MSVLKLTIIETGEAPVALRGRFPDYPAMFRQMFASVDADIACETVSVVKGEALPDPARLGAILYTGSPAGVYDAEPWIAPLMTFVRGAAAAGIAQAGICFGHQLMAQALGGAVAKSERGWGLGRHTYDLLALPEAHPAYLAAPALRITVSHQDQVITPPPAARVIAQSAFTPFAGLVYADTSAISFQCHPEFDADFAAALYGARRGVSLSEADADAAIASLTGPCDRRLLASGLANFLRQTARA